MKTRSADSVVGELLSLALLTVVGICVLLLGEQLCHRGVWRRSPAVQLADVRTAGEHYRRIDVWNLGQRPVCNCDPPCQPRSTILALIFGASVYEDLRGKLEAIHLDE
jgi:hypothetical protein